MNIPKKAIIYCRVSSQKQSKLDNYSFEEQEKECLKFAGMYGLKVINRQRETISGWKDTKRNLLRSILKDNTFTTIIVYDVSRFARNYDVGVELLNLAKKNNNVIVFAIEKTFNDSMVNLTKLKEAENQAMQLSQKIKNVKKVMKENGFFTGGMYPYGTKVVKIDEGRILVPEKTEMCVVDLINYLSTNAPNIVETKRLIELINLPNVNINYPIEFEICDSDGASEYVESFEYPMTAYEISEFLNNYEIFPRKDTWSESKIKTIIKRIKTGDYEKYKANLNRIENVLNPNENEEILVNLLRKIRM